MGAGAAAAEGQGPKGGRGRGVKGGSGGREGGGQAGLSGLMVVGWASRWARVKRVGADRCR
eukprot:COSAG04_NODE_985_length_8992_cov_18.901844_6_plen_61_part_00